MSDLALDIIRKKVFFHNSIDVWISACDENNTDWFNAENYKKATGGNYTLLLLALAYQTALVDGVSIFQVQERINTLAKDLGVDPDDHNQIRAKYSLEALKTPYHVLEIPPSASDDIIKKAYRQKASEFHPDRVAHLGQDQVEAAHLIFLEVQAAYRELEQVRGL